MGLVPVSFGYYGKPRFTRWTGRASLRASTKVETESLDHVCSSFLAFFNRERVEVSL